MPCTCAKDPSPSTKQLPPPQKSEAPRFMNKSPLQGFLFPWFYLKTPLQWSKVTLFYQIVNRQGGFVNRKIWCFHPVELEKSHREKCSLEHWQLIFVQRLPIYCEWPQTTPNRVGSAWKLLTDLTSKRSLNRSFCCGWSDITRIEIV